MGIWIIVCVQKPCHHFLQTFHPLGHYACLRLCSAIVHFIQKNCLFLCAMADQRKLRQTVGLENMNMTSQTMHTKHKWHYTPLNEPPPHEHFLRAPLGNPSQGERNFFNVIIQPWSKGVFCITWHVRWPTEPSVGRFPTSTLRKEIYYRNQNSWNKL